MVGIIIKLDINIHYWHIIYIPFEFLSLCFVCGLTAKLTYSNINLERFTKCGKESFFYIYTISFHLLLLQK